MSEQRAETGSGRQVGRKIWYGTVIFLSALVILTSVAGIVGTWVVGRALSDAAVQLLAGVERAAGAVEELAVNVDQGISEVQGLTLLIGEATRQVGENVTDKGLLLTLLPEEREQRLVERVESLASNLAAIREVVNTALSFYQALDAVPFVSLPKPDPEKLEEIQQAVTELETGAAQLAQGIKDFRAGVAGAVGKITELTDRIGSRLDRSRENLALLRTEMTLLQQRAAELREMVPAFFTTVGLLLTAFLAFIVYTQVETIRLFVGRWKALRAPAAALPAAAFATPAEPVEPETQLEASLPVETPVAGIPTEETPAADTTAAETPPVDGAAAPGAAPAEA